MAGSQRLTTLYLPPDEGFVLQSLVATTYEVDFEFLEEELLATALGVRAPVSRIRAFRSELERRLEGTEVSILYDLRACQRLARLSPRIDALPVASRKLHAKISLLMWVRRHGDSPKTDRWIRLIVGSANLTRQGFRENYECGVALDSAGRNQSPRHLLIDAIDFVRQIGEETGAPQFRQQLDDFRSQAAELPETAAGKNDPTAFVTARDVVAGLRSNWEDLSSTAPESIKVVSPFWPEGASAADPLAELFGQFGAVDRLELLCRGKPSPDSQDWLPEFEPHAAAELRKQIAGRVSLRPALPNVGVERESALDDRDADEDDETEDIELARRFSSRQPDKEAVERPLHAKMILLDGAAGSVLYVGSSNCTRRGLGLGGPWNWEAGLIYRLSPSQRRELDALLTFAGPSVEIEPGRSPRTVEPTREQEPPVPTFLSEVIASPDRVEIRFRDGEPVPADLVILMPVPTKSGDAGNWLLYGANGTRPADNRVQVDLTQCPRCDTQLVKRQGRLTNSPRIPHVVVEVRWQGNSARFPVRFDEKNRLPLFLIGRRPTEGELLEYFLLGREPDVIEPPTNTASGADAPGPDSDDPVDTRHILSYFVRRFTQAVPGIEAEIRRASYARKALAAALEGPTSPLELARQASCSLSRPPRPDEPCKTPAAVGFQLIEIQAALLRCRERTADPELRRCFDPVVGGCREMLDRLTATHPELQDESFASYRRRFTGDPV